MNFGFDATALITGQLPLAGGSTKSDPFELRAGPFFGGELRVLSILGRERVNDVFSYEVTFATSVQPELLPAALFGEPAFLTIKAPGHDPRIIGGLAASLEALGAVPGEQGGKRRRYRLEIVPRLYLLKHRRQNRVFQNKSTIEIVQTLLDAIDIRPAQVHWRVRDEDCPKLPFVYQRDESDYDFFRRVLANAGIFFYFEHASGLLDSLLPGAGAVAGMVGEAAGMLGGAVGGAVAGVEAATKMVTVLNFGGEPGHTPAVTAGAISGAIGGAISAGLGGLAGAIGGSVAAGMIEDPSDTIQFDDGMGADSDADRVYEFEMRKELRPKALRLVDRDVEAPASWVGVAEVPSVSVDASASLSAGLSGGLSFGPGGLSGGLSGALSAAVHASVSFDVDAPNIRASELREERYQVDPSVWQDTQRGSTTLFPGKRMLMELERVREKYVEAQGRSDCRRLGAAYRFTLAGHPIKMLNGEYTITSLEVRGVHPDFASDGEPVYRNKFRCIPSRVAPRPKRRRRRRKLGMEIATVVGYVGGEMMPGLHASPSGHVKIRFRWDILDDLGTPAGSLELGPDDAYTVWVPLVQPWAGAGYGAQFIPREGMEVLVGFLEGQGERPVILGCLYSEASPPPWPGDVENQKVGIRSQTRPKDGGYSEISIDDRADKEVVAVRAQRNFEVTVLRESKTNVGADLITTVRGGANAHVFHDRSERVDGSATTTIAGGETVHVGANRSTKIGGAHEHRVGGSETVNVAGSQAVLVGASARYQIAGTRNDAVKGDLVTTVGERYALTVGTAGTSVAESNTYVWGQYRVGSKDRLVVESETEIVLRCGGSELHIKPDGITLDAKTFQATASKQLSLFGNGPSLSLGDDVQVLSKQIAMQSQGSRLSMSSSAALTGSSVSLGQPAQNQISPSQASLADPNAFKLKVVDPDHTPLANCKYLLELAGKTMEGTTDADGNVTGSAPPGITTGRCTVWMDDFPVGPNMTIDLKFETMEPATDIAGAQKRLRNLGYFNGDPTTEMNYHLRDAILVFQHTQGLPRTGLLDDATTAKLAEIHP